MRVDQSCVESDKSRTVIARALKWHRYCDRSQVQELLVEQGFVSIQVVPVKMACWSLAKGQGKNIVYWTRENMKQL